MLSLVSPHQKLLVTSKAKDMATSELLSLIQTRCALPLVIPLQPYLTEIQLAWHYPYLSPVPCIYFVPTFSYHSCWRPIRSYSLSSPSPLHNFPADTANSLYPHSTNSPRAAVFTKYISSASSLHALCTPPGTPGTPAVAPRRRSTCTWPQVYHRVSPCC